MNMDNGTTNTIYQENDLQPEETDGKYWLVIDGCRGANIAFSV